MSQLITIIVSQLITDDTNEKKNFGSKLERFTAPATFVSLLSAIVTNLKVLVNDSVDDSGPCSCLQNTH
jgi:hypothetical protein